MTKVSHLLDIFLITYNREKQLERTLSQIFAENSPIRDYELTIIDNNSTDNTAIVVKNYQDRFPNLKYKKNKYNIGGNANIARTFELAEKDYIWILCDDDNYDWNSWHEVEEAILNGEDAIVVGNIDHPKLGIQQLFAQTSFLPSVIYKTSNIDEALLDNIHYNIANMFPHMAISAKLINEEKSFKIISPIVFNGIDENSTVEESYTRGVTKKDLHPYRNDLSYLAGYANTLMFIKNPKLRNFLAVNRRFYNSRMCSGKTFFDNANNHNNSLYNIFCIFNTFNLINKIKFLLQMFLFYSLYRIIYIYCMDSFNETTKEITLDFRMRLFYIIKLKLFKYKYKGKL